MTTDRGQLSAAIDPALLGTFDDVHWRPGPLGSPVRDDAVSWIECTVEEIREAGDHVLPWRCG